LTKAKLYEVFTDQHLEREAQKVFKKGEKLPEGFDIKISAKNYQMALAA